MPLQANTVAVLPALPQQVYSHRAVLGHLSIALERDQVGRYGNDADVGQDDDLEGHSPNRRPQSEGLPKGGDPEQAGAAGGGKPTDARL